MKYKHLNKIILLLTISFIVNSCTEQYALQTNTFEDALVVEATITNELKKQEIKITRTYRLEEEETTIESGATVTVTDNENNKYDFDLKDTVYVSQSEFQAIPGRKYRLDIVTKEGKLYYSTSETLPSVNEIQSVDATVQTFGNQRGVQITVNSYDPKNSSKYYRYEYEETYKIVTPLWDQDKAILLPPLPESNHKEIGLIPREGESKICYSTDKSKEILISSTNSLKEDRIAFPIRFISNQNYIISHRYSILTKQYIQNLEAYTYYKTLKELSGSDNILSQNQPGFFYGNIKSSENPNEKVVGFFDVSSVSSKRIFFNYLDLFPGEPLPPYFDSCDIRVWTFCFISENPDCRGAQLLSTIESNKLVYLNSYQYSNPQFTTYEMVPIVCGDCTSFSSNIVPPFWTN
ncbi:Protein of unknown function DUF4249 [Flavobacteriaceae bacterium]